MDVTQLIFWQIVLGGAVRLGTPVAFAALGETIVEKSGMLNIGIDGMMTVGAFAGAVGAFWWGWGAGVLCGGLAGLVCGLLMAVVVLRGGANQVIVGIAISLLGSGVTTFLFQIWQPSGQSAYLFPLVPTLSLPALQKIPLIGDALFNQSALTYGGIVIFLTTALVLRWTRYGLILRASGDAPVAAALQGIDVVKVRTAALAYGGLLAGLGGAAVTVGYVGSFTDGIVAGRGYVALAIVIIGRWTPLGGALGALFFAFFDSLALRVQTGEGFLPVEAYMTLPYAATLLALVLTTRGKLAPRALGAPVEAD